MIKVAIYSRVSTTEQDIENQLSVLKDWAARRDFEIVQVYQEEESAWRAGHQRELAKLIKAARIGRFKVVLVWSLDRLSRQGSLAILQLVNKLGNYGVKVVSYQESWTDVPSEFQEVLLAIAGWVARMESQRISERTKAGIERKRREFGGKLPVRGRDKHKRKRRRI